MSMTDPISNVLTIIRNGTKAEKETVDVPASKIIEKILNIFKEDGYIVDFRLMKSNVQGTFKIYLKYENRQPAIAGLKRISKPGLRVYASSGKLPRVLSGFGTAVLSTSKGIIRDKEARKAHIGGEVLCHIW